MRPWCPPGFTIGCQPFNCTASLNFWTAFFPLLTIHSAENSGVFEDSCPRESLGITSLILCSKVSCCLPSRSIYTDSPEFSHSRWLISPVRVLSGAQRSRQYVKIVIIQGGGYHDESASCCAMREVGRGRGSTL